MKIILNLPDWVKEKHLYVLAGIELVAYKYKNEEWKVKTSRCNMCGECCKGFSDKKTFPPKENGTCIYLKKSGDIYECGLGINRPFRCCVGVSNLEKCTEEYEKIWQRKIQS